MWWFLYIRRATSLRCLLQKTIISNNKGTTALTAAPKKNLVVKANCHTLGDCRQTETGVSQSLRIRYPFPHYLILCQRAMENLLQGRQGGRQPWGSGWYWEMCTHTHTHDHKARHKWTRCRLSHVGPEIPSCTLLDTDVDSISLKADIRLRVACLLTVCWLCNWIHSLHSPHCTRGLVREGGRGGKRGGWMHE